MNIEKKWYAIYTRPGRETKVAKSLSKRNVENYCPLNRVVSRWAEQHKKVLKPLFSTYVFVHLNAAEYLTIKQTNGVLNFVYWLDQPAQIKDEDIQAIRVFLSEHAAVKLEKINEYVEGDRPQAAGSSVKIFLRSLHYIMSAVPVTESREILQPQHTITPIRLTALITHQNNLYENRPGNLPYQVG